MVGLGAVHGNGVGFAGILAVIEFHGRRIFHDLIFLAWGAGHFDRVDVVCGHGHGRGIVVVAIRICAGERRRCALGRIRPIPGGFAVGMLMRRRRRLADDHIEVRVRQIIALTVRGDAGGRKLAARTLGRIQAVAGLGASGGAFRGVRRNEDRGRLAVAVRTGLDVQLEAEVRIIGDLDLIALRIAVRVAGQRQADIIILRIRCSDRVGSRLLAVLKFTPCKRRPRLLGLRVAGFVHVTLIAVLFEIGDRLEKRSRDSRRGFTLRNAVSIFIPNMDEVGVVPACITERVAGISLEHFAVDSIPRLKVRAVVVDLGGEEAEIEIRRDAQLHFDNIARRQCGILTQRLEAAARHLVKIQTVRYGAFCDTCHRIEFRRRVELRRTNHRKRTECHHKCKQNSQGLLCHFHVLFSSLIILVYSILLSANKTLYSSKTKYSKKLSGSFVWLM